MARRSIVLDGVTTSINLDDVFWKELDRRARQSGMPWYDYMRALLERAESSGNRAATVRDTLFRTLRAELDALAGIHPRARWRLSTPASERVLHTSGPRIRVGRSLDNEIVVDDADVSRKHLLLAHDGEHWWGVDLGSRNGTWLQRKRITAHRLVSGKTLALGASGLVRLD